MIGEAPYEDTVARWLMDAPDPVEGAQRATVWATWASVAAMARNPGAAPAWRRLSHACRGIRLGILLERRRGQLEDFRSGVKLRQLRAVATFARRDGCSEGPAYVELRRQAAARLREDEGAR